VSRTAATGVARAVTVRLVPVALAIALLTLPSRGTGQTPPNVPAVRAQDGDALTRITGRILLDTLATWVEVPGGNAQVFARMKHLLDSLGMPPSRVDSVGGLIMSEGFVARGGRFAGRKNSTWLRCGFGPSGNYADNWRVSVIYGVYVHPGSMTEVTRLGFALTGNAKDMSGSTSSNVQCTSTGELERSVAGALRGYVK
jgi:hypothetical protein